MTFEPTVSLIIVSRMRQAGLRRLVSSLRFQTYLNFEVIIVGDAPDAGFLSDLPFANNIHYIAFDQPNISAARNIGLGYAQGEIVAFCDDDAVPDPGWLAKLVQPFVDSDVASAGGYVRARNGIEFQWTSLTCDALGEDSSIDIPEVAPFTIVPFDGTRFAKLQGTNCAFRRSALLEINGFDEGFRFFLDETDVCLRLAKIGYLSAFVPFAQVHHGFEESEQRTHARVPRNLFEIGASQRRYLAKHAPDKDHQPTMDRLFHDQNARLVSLMVDGFIEPRDVAKLLATLTSGLQHDPNVHLSGGIKEQLRVFRSFGHKSQVEMVALAGTRLSRAKLIGGAIDLGKNGRSTMVFRFSLTSFYHKRVFDLRGFWIQTGGLFGKSKRTDKPMSHHTIKSRVLRELKEMADIFPVGEIRVIKVFGKFAVEKTKSNLIGNTRIQ
jgi:GT2 family glycosyltransferase